MGAFYVDDRSKDQSIINNMFGMAEFCQVFLTAKHIREGDDSFIPFIKRGELEKMPKEVVEEMNKMFMIALTELEKFGDNPKGFIEQMKEGSYDPFDEFIKQPVIRDAIGNVLIRKLRVSRGLRGQEAIDEAKRLLPEAQQMMRGFVGNNVTQAMDALAQKIMELDLGFDNLSDKIEAEVTMIDDNGIGFGASIKPEVAKRAQKKLKTKQKEDKKNFEFDMGWG
jgi:hypothetical protein